VSEIPKDDLSGNCLDMLAKGLLSTVSLGLDQDRSE
jgi:hypothetical protein